MEENQTGDDVMVAFEGSVVNNKSKTDKFTKMLKDLTKTFKGEVKVMK